MTLHITYTVYNGILLGKYNGKDWTPSYCLNYKSHYPHPQKIKIKGQTQSYEVLYNSLNLPNKKNRITGNKSFSTDEHAPSCCEKMPLGLACTISSEKQCDYSFSYSEFNYNYFKSRFVHVYNKARQKYTKHLKPKSALQSTCPLRQGKNIQL